MVGAFISVGKLKTNPEIGTLIGEHDARFIPRRDGSCCRWLQVASSSPMFTTTVLAAALLATT